MKPQWLINGLGSSAELLYNVVKLAADKSDLFYFPVLQWLEWLRGEFGTSWNEASRYSELLTCWGEWSCGTVASIYYYYPIVIVLSTVTQ